MIVTRNLTKVYGDIKAVEDLNLEVRPGEIFGFLGPNGAGKTTTIRILTTLTKPTSGNAWIGGFDVVSQPQEVKKMFGVVQQHLSLDRELTVWEVMELHARLHGLGSRERRKRIAELLDYVGLAKQAERRIGELSGGMKRRVMVARALIHHPRLLLLDEPTVGLDAQARRRIWELIRRLNSEGATIFLTTHYIEEAEALCHRVGIIHRGRLIALGSPLELRLRLGLAAVETLLDDRVHYRYFPSKEEATAYVQSLPPEVKMIVVRDSNLEDVFVELTGRKVEDGEDTEG
ncbi:MAG: ABC transporter ATP-binding protein [Candidatus Latescibacterota bacterium]|nr:MAG: ABC transporter ATP-binding protein [Candidatus Latescibacterota bacterium]